MTQRYKLTIEYKGIDYAGWQRQKDPDVIGVQQLIEEAIAAFYPYDETPQLTAAGRTDAGVHARGQVAHIDLKPFSKPMDGFEIAKAISAHLRPNPITILSCEPVDSEFHARFDATNKLYAYSICVRPALSALDQDLLWHMRRPPKQFLNLAAMQEGANHLLGHHDFTSFRDSQCQAKSPMRTLDRLEIIKETPLQPTEQRLRIEAEGKSFLHHQVRNMVGTLALVGEGKITPDDVKTILKACDRTKAGPTAPADGLYLMRIDY